MESKRFSVTSSGGSRNGNRYAVLDSLERDEHGGRLRVSFWPTFAKARAECRKLNAEHEAGVGRENMPAQPFRMLPSRHAMSRYVTTDLRGVERQVVKSGRASYVWLHGVLVPLACGVTGEAEVSMGPDTKWHRVTGADDSYRQIIEHYRSMTGLQRLVRNHRQRRGLPI